MTIPAELAELFATHPDTPRIRAQGQDASISREPDCHATAIAITVRLLNLRNNEPSDKWLLLRLQSEDALKIAASIWFHAQDKGWPIDPGLLDAIQRIKLPPNKNSA
jgi:hypothetical protein